MKANAELQREVEHYKKLAADNLRLLIECRESRAIPKGHVNVPAERLLAIADALIDHDCDEAYHQLYQLQLAVAGADPFKPWAHIRLAAATKGTP